MTSLAAKKYSVRERKYVLMVTKIDLLNGRRLEVHGPGRLVLYMGSNDTNPREPFYYEHPGGRTYKATPKEVIDVVLRHVGYEAVEKAVRHNDRNRVGRQRANRVGRGAVDAVELSKIRVLYRDGNGSMGLWGIPYDMRPGQSPRDLRRAHESYSPPRPGSYGAKQVDLSDWVWLGSPGWYGSMTADEIAEVKRYLTWFRDAVPNGPNEFSELPSEVNWPYRQGR